MGMIEIFTREWQRQKANLQAFQEARKSRFVVLCGIMEKEIIRSSATNSKAVNRIKFV